MAEARERSEWNRTSVLVAKLHNVNQIKRSDLISFEDVHPFHIQRHVKKAEPTRADLIMLKSAIKGM